MTARQLYRKQSDGSWTSPGRLPGYSGFVAFDLSDVFAGAVVPYDPEFESGGAGRYPVGSRIPRASCTRVDVDTFTPTAGQEYSGLDIYCRVFAPATVSDGAFWMHDCYVTPTFTSAQRPTATKPMVGGHNLDFGGALFEWVTLGGAAASTSVWQNCIEGGNWTARYCALSRGVDALKMNTVGNGVAEGCRISHGHYNAYWNDSTGLVRSANFTDFGGTAWNIGEINDGHSDGQVHADGAQTGSGTGWKIRGCRIGGSRYDALAATNMDPTVSADYARIQGYDADASFANSAIIANSDGTTHVGLLVEYCLLEEGAATINLPWRTEDDGSGVTIKDTLIVPNSHGFQIYRQTVTGSNAATITNVLKTTDRSAASINTY
jgi:hypothetical protein